MSDYCKIEPLPCCTTYEKVEPSLFAIETIKEILAQQRIMLEFQRSLFESLASPWIIVGNGTKLKDVNDSIAKDIQRMKEKPQGTF